MNIDMSALDDSMGNRESLGMDISSQNEESKLSLEDVMDVTDMENPLNIDNDEHSDSKDDSEWTLGDFKTENEMGSGNEEVTGSEDDATVSLEITTEITVDQH
jgi:hypothetical protein